MLHLVLQVLKDGHEGSLLCHGHEGSLLCLGRQFLTSQLGEALEAGAEVGLAQALWKTPSPHTTTTFTVIGAAMAGLWVGIVPAPDRVLIPSDEPTTYGS